MKAFFGLCDKGNVIWCGSMDVRAEAEIVFLMKKDVAEKSTGGINDGERERERV